MQAVPCRLLVLLLLLIMKSDLKSTNKCQAPLGFSPAELEDEMQLCLQGLLQCPVSPASPQGICCPALDITAHPAAHEKCQLPWVGFKTGSAQSEDIDT